MGKPALHYFSGRGLIEPIRLILNDAKVDYEKKEFGVAGPGASVPDFKELKESGILDFGSVPLWEEEGLQLVQSASIARHLGRKYGYSGDNENEASKIDEIIEGVRDAITTARKVAHAPEDQRAKALQDLITVDIPKWLGFFETILKKNNTGFFVGNKISVAEFYVFSFLEEAKCAKVPLESFPLLQKNYELISCRPQIASYLSSSRYPPNFAKYIK